MQNEWDHQLLFPTRVITQQSDDQAMIDDLRHMFRVEKKYQDQKFNDMADLENMLDHAERYPALHKLKKFMWEGMVSWLKGEGITGDYAVQTSVFPNYGKAGAFVPAHNHIAHVSGVYYVDIPDADPKQQMFVQEDYKRYWAQDRGVLILHDPRYNASLVELTEKNYVKFFPQPGMAILFPAYLWHSVTPHQSAQDRISIAFNFSVIPKDELEIPIDYLTL